MNNLATIMAETLPYVNAYGQIHKLFTAITKAAVPPKFTYDFLSSVLELKSGSHRAMIPLMKRLGFLDQSSVPTQLYKDYRDDALAKATMAKAIKAAYSPLFIAHEYVHTLGKNELAGKIKNVTGLGENDPMVNVIVGTFTELCKLADFQHKVEDLQASKQKPKTATDAEEKRSQMEMPKLGISYTINLNLPATTEIEVFNAIFKSLKEHILLGK
jgi:hypothetical protein